MTEKMKNALTKASHIGVVVGLLGLPVLMFMSNPLWLFLIFPLMWGLYEWRGLTRGLAFVPIMGVIMGVFADVLWLVRTEEIPGCDYDFWMSLAVGSAFFVAVVTLNTRYFKHLQTGRKDTVLNGLIYIVLFGVLIVVLRSFLLGWSWNECGLSPSACERVSYSGYYLVYAAMAVSAALWGLTQSFWFKERRLAKCVFGVIVSGVILAISAAYIVKVVCFDAPALRHKCAVGTAALYEKFGVENA